MTEKLFEADSYISEFDCEVISFGEDKNRIYIETDKTAFFPEGGGQTSDKGYLDGLYISDVQLIDGRIFHYTESTPEALDLLKSKNICLKKKARNTLVQYLKQRVSLLIFMQ